MVVKKICKIKTNLSEIRKALNLPPASSTEFRRCLCVAIFIILESQSEGLGLGLVLISYNFLKRCLNARLTVACKWL